MPPMALNTAGRTIIDAPEIQSTASFESVMCLTVIQGCSNS